MMPKIPATSKWSVVCVNPLAQLLLASALAGGASALTGCSADSSSGQMANGAGSEPVSTTRSALSPLQFTWSQGGPFLLETMMPMNTHFCYLTGMSGRFRGQGESVHVTNDPSGNGYWALTGSSGQVGVSATAMCVPWSSFSNPDWHVFWDEYVQNNGSCAMTGDAFQAGCISAQLQGPASFCSLSGVAGRLMVGGNFELGFGPSDCGSPFGGGLQFGNEGDVALVQFAPPTEDPQNLQGVDLAFVSGVTNAYAQTTAPYPCRVNGWDPTLSDWSECMSFNNSPAINVSQYYTVTNGGTVFMGGVEDEFCALAGVSGSFDGPSESVSIYSSDVNDINHPYWVLSASDNKVSATAVCVLYPGTNLRTFGVFRGSTGEWYIGHNNLSTVVNDNSTGPWGLPGDLPVAGDWDGDGRTGVGVFRPSTGQWFFSNSVNPVGTFLGPTTAWGLPGDQPVAGDWDGDGTITIGLFRPATGEWFFSNSIAHPQTDIYSPQWGLPGDQPVAGDWDGDGRYGVGLFRPSTGQWFFSNSVNPAATSIGPTSAWGLNGDLPIAGDWAGNRKPTIGVFRPSTGEWFFSNSISNPETDIHVNVSTPYGSPGDYPIAASSDRLGWVARWQF